MKHQLHLLLALCCCILFSQTYSQLAGSLDPAFAIGGIGSYSMGMSKTTIKKIQVILLQPNGKIIIAGTVDQRMAIIRLNQDETIDAGFGQNSVFFIKTGISSTLASAVLQPDGKILFVGNNDNGSYNDCSVVRLNSNGSVDNSFGSDGKLLISAGSSYIKLNSVALQSNGKILLTGTSNDDFLAMRLNSDGSTDSSFDGDGTVQIPVGKYRDYAQFVTVQPDGKILLAGVSYTGVTIHHDEPDFSVVRLNRNGRLDKSFGNNGKLVVPVDSTYDYAQSMALQPDGKILVAGYSNNLENNNFTFLVVRMNSSGILDTSFDSDGKLTLPTGSPDQATPIILQPDGKILLAGSIKIDASYPLEFSVVRLKSNGSLDSSFLNNGKVAIYKRGNDYANSIALQPDGKILVAGYNPPYYDFSIVRVDSNGFWDNSFSTYWLDQQYYGSDGNAFSTALQPDGKILLAGYSAAADDADFSVVRLNSKGKLDSSFDGDGKLRMPGYSYGDGYSETARKIVLQPDGKMLLAGSSSSFFGEKTLFAVMRLKHNGSIDNSFNGVGEVRIPAIGDNLEVSSMALQPDGKILLAGNSSNEKGEIGFSLVRLNSNGSRDNSFDDDGKLWLQAGTSLARVYSIALQPDGKILLAGYSKNTDSADYSGDFLVVRLNNNGSLDNRFNSGGKLLIQGGYFDAAYSVALQPDGKILLAGASHDYNGSNSVFMAARVNSNRGLDSTFGSGGKVLMAVGIGGDDKCYSIALQPDGKILLAGSSKNGDNEDFCVVRLNSNGRPDSSFNNNGKAVANTPYFEHATASVLQPDGNLLIAGYGEGDTPGDNFIAMRFLGCGHRDCSPVKLKISDAEVTEGNDGTRKVKLLVSLSRTSAQNIIVNYATHSGTAKSSSDYIRKRDTLVFAPGITSKTIFIKINGDTQAEPDETFNVTLSNPVNAILDNTKGIVTILNDDSTTIVSTNSSNSIQKIKDQPSLKIYSNPAISFLTIELLGYEGNITLQFQSLQGKILKQEKIQAAGQKHAQYQVNLVNIASGVYFLHVFDDHGKYQTEKVIVNR